MSQPPPVHRLLAYLAAGDVPCGLVWHDGLGWYVGEDEADVPIVMNRFEPVDPREARRSRR